jgi:hypothetical protein
MSLLVLPYPTFTGGDTIMASEANANNAAISTWSSQLDDSNLLNSGITLSTKGKPGSINSTLMSVGAVKQGALEFSSTGVGCLLWRAGTAYRGSSGNRLIVAKKGFTLTAATTTEYSQAISWATDSVDGVAAFSGTPDVVGWSLLDDTASAIHGTAAELAYFVVTAISNLGCTVKFRFRVTSPGGAITIILFVAGGA